MSYGDEVKSARAAWMTSLASPMILSVITLGIVQIITWGTTLYSLGVLGGPIATGTGWSRSLVFSGLTVGLLVSSAVSTLVGRAIDRHGARVVMVAGLIINAVGLVIVALAHHPILYLAGWAVMGPGMRMTLYDAAFAALVQVTPSRGRRAISYLTLFGGFASTVFWPIGHVLDIELGWRTTLWVFATLNLVVCVPLVWWGLARREDGRAAGEGAGTGRGDTLSSVASKPLEGSTRTIAIVLFAIVTSATAFVFGAMAVHLPAVLMANGLTAAAAVTLASVKGVAQVAGRVGDILFGSRLHPLNLARLSILLMPLSFVILMGAGGTISTALLFIVLFGASNGLVTIVRGAVPLALFGPKGYGEVLGVLAAPYLLVNALAPAATAFVIDRWGYSAAEGLLVAAGVFATVSMEIMMRWYRRRLASAGA